MFNFERLEAWQHALDIAETVYIMTRAFPSEERYGLASQLRRAAVSVSANLAEGASRISSQEQVRFVEIALGSLHEVVSEAAIGKRQGFVGDDDFARLYAMAEKQGRMLSGLRRSLVGEKLTVPQSHRP